MTKAPTSVQLLSFGESSDAYHISSPHPEGEGAIQSMGLVLERAGLRADEIDYVNLHGTATVKNDEMEAKAMKAVFKDHPVLVSSTKHKTGHCLGAAGSIEAYFCCEVLSEKNQAWLPWHQSDLISEEFDHLNFVHQGSVIPNRVKTVMSNSFAFGGSNCTLIFGMNDG